MTDHLIPVDYSQTKKINPKEVTSHSPNHVRLYPTSPNSVALQIRTEGPIGVRHNGASYQCYSHASLNQESATKLRDALNEWLDTFKDSDKIERTSRQINDLSTDELLKVLGRLNKETLEDMYRDKP